MAKKEIVWINRKERSVLKDILPLEEPLSIIIEPINLCNFKCTYCTLPQDQKNKINRGRMPLDVFNKIAAEAKTFKKKLKTINFSGFGEPLMHTDLSKMVRLAKEIAQETVVITNGSLLTKEKSDELIASGLDTIRISLQGVIADQCYQTCGVRINMEKFAANIKYFYDNKRQCMVYIKVPDLALEEKSHEKICHQIFDPICDSLTIQPIAPLFESVDYSKIKNKFDKSLLNQPLLETVTVCPQPFYNLQIYADGGIQPCCAPTKLVIGNINQTGMLDVWNGSPLKKIRQLHLKGEKSRIKACKTCAYPRYVNNAYDNLDAAAPELLLKY